MADDDPTTTTSTSSSTTSNKPKSSFGFKKRGIAGSTSSSFRKRQKPKQQQQVGRSPSPTAADADDDDDVPTPTTTKVDVAAQNNSSIIDDNDENDEDENDESQSALSAVLATERRRKLLGRRNRGVDAATLGVIKHTASSSISSSSVKHGGVAAGGGIGSSGGSIEKSHADLEGRLMGGRTFAGGRSAGSNDMGGDGDDGDCGEFIQKNLRDKQDQKVGNGEKNGGDDDIDGNLDGQYTSHATSDSAERELYAELLLSTENDNGRTQMNDSDIDGGGNKLKSGTEGDVGAGGAVMGGTGIAEVALPIDERLRAARATEMAALERERARTAKRNYYDGGVEPSLSLSSSALPGNTIFASSHSNNNNDLLGASYSHNFQLHTKEWVSRRRDERQFEIDALRTAREATEGNTTVENRARIGFEAARRSAKQGGGASASTTATTTGGGSGGARAHKDDDPSMRNEWDRKQGGDARSNDERVWRTFMTKQRNRR
ncbi:hypothetical protein ACHAWU_007497 [Discostella pseudostelligera]|uniref:Uncharacterized protein n=1 Tax=Discostella pseudostelligera TaxID=259834 RepID=A0ABD3M0V0_9STRA